MDDINHVTDDYPTPNLSVGALERGNGEYQTYDPRRLSGITVYREVEREAQLSQRVTNIL